jgi:hypothetical protein
MTTPRANLSCTKSPPTCSFIFISIRLKVVNRAQDGALVLSTSDFTIQWGYGPSRPSELAVTP